MNEVVELFDWFARDLGYRLVVTLLHFFWQATAIGLLAYAATRTLRRENARHAYAVNVACLFTAVLAAILTFILVQPPQEFDSHSQSRPVPRRTPTTQPISSIQRQAPTQTPNKSASSNLTHSKTPFTAPVSKAAFDFQTTISQWCVPIATCYLAVVSLMLFRLGRGVWRATFIKRVSLAIENAELLAIADRTAKRIGLAVTPAIAWCEQISTPIVIGLIRPMILLPAAMISGVTSQQMEAILAHEMAHIRRFDLPINLFQRFTESVFFFHPAVWYLTRNIDIEREKATDDFALNAGCAPVQYADALLRLAELSVGQHDDQRSMSAFSEDAVLAASGRRHSELKQRIVRVIGSDPQPQVYPHRFFNYAWMGAVLTLAILVTYGVTVSFSRDTTTSVGNSLKKEKEVVSPHRMRLKPEQNPGVPAEIWQLYCAASNGDVETVRQVVRDNPEFMHHFIQYECPLQYAVRENRQKVVRVLLDAGINPAFSNFQYSSWPKLLLLAKERKHTKIHEMLVAEMQKRFNYDPSYRLLWDAIASGDVGKVKQLTEADPNLVNVGDEHGNRAIHWAILCRRIPIIQILLDAGADINVKRADMQPPLQLAIAGHDYWFDKKHHSSDTPAWEVTKFIRDQGADYDFFAAVAFNDIEYVKAALTRNPALANQLSESRRSPLFIASERNIVEMVRLLLDHGADPNQPEHLASKGHALFAASARNNIEMMKLLLDHGARADAYSDSMGTCLSIAQQGGPRELVAVSLLKQHLPNPSK